MNYLALMFAAIAKPVDVPGQFRAVIVTLIVFVFIIKIVGLFMPTKRHLFFLLLRNQKGKTSNGKLIPCPDCKGSISPKASVCPHCGAPIDASYARKIYEGRNRALIAKRESNFMANMIVMGFLGLGLAICALASMSKVPGMGLFACIGLVLFFVAALRIYVHFNKGKIGELLVKARLRKGLPAEQYSILELFLKENRVKVIKNRLYVPNCLEIIKHAAYYRKQKATKNK